MSLQYKLRRDANERKIVHALRCAGCKVWRLFEFDLVVQRGETHYLIEVKAPGGAPTEAQRKRAREGWKIRLVRTEEDALRAVGLLAGPAPPWVGVE